jgi:hypothetical protein
MNAGVWVANRRVFLDANGNAVEANDPTRVELLVPEGGKLPMSRAIALGLAGDKVAQPNPEAIKGGEPATILQGVDKVRAAIEAFDAEMDAVEFETDEELKEGMALVDEFLSPYIESRLEAKITAELPAVKKLISEALKTQTDEAKAAKLEMEKSHKAEIDGLKADLTAEKEKVHELSRKLEASEKKAVDGPASDKSVKGPDATK